MGFLSKGDTLTWDEAKKYRDYIREHGIIQFLSILANHRDREGDPFIWGDEIEYFVVRFDDHERTVKLDLRANDILVELARQEEENPDNPDLPSLWRPEYGRFMIESTPGTPYCGLPCIDQVEQNMALRRAALLAQLDADEGAFTMSHFPMIGTSDHTFPPTQAKGPIANSLYISDDIINAHKRFATLTQNIRFRRGSNVAINVPLFKDVNTKPLRYDDCFPGVPKEEIPALDDHIYADAMAFGMGQCCLQCTFQAYSIREARMLYDTLVPFAPIALALTASTPILRGLLADWDVRWNIISAAVDDRTPEERGLVPLKDDKFVIAKSRYASVSSYIDNDPSRVNVDDYNDLQHVINPDCYQMLLDAGVDVPLARHIAHLFIRDPLVIYDGSIELDDTTRSDHFENIQSTNWQTVRWKPPPPPPNKQNIGWRVEFRPMESQFTDFESAAFVVFIVLCTLVIKDRRLNFYMPLSKVDENMQRAHARDAVLQEKFWFRKNVLDNGPAEVVEMSVDEIINGAPRFDFPGLIPLIRDFVREEQQRVSQDCTTQVDLIDRYLTLISKRANGSLLTNAAWIRAFIARHPDYKQDSVVTQSIAYDLLKHIDKIAKGEVEEPTLLGDLRRPVDLTTIRQKRPC